MFVSQLSLLKKRFILPFVVLLVLSGCEQTFSARNTQKPSATIHAGNTTLTSKKPSLGTSVAFDLGGWIHVQSASGFTCNADPQSPPGLLILPTVRPTYDQGTLQSAQNYMTALYKNPGDIIDASGATPHHRDTVLYPLFSADASAFQLVAVSDTYSDCDEFLHITNRRNTPIQITPSSVTFTAETYRNTQHYNLIEGCSLLSLIPGCSPSLGGQESEYDAVFVLHPGKVNTIIPASISRGGSTKALTLQPGEVAKVILTYVTSPSDNFFFSLMPSFTIGLPGEQPTTYPVPQLQETFAFASGRVNESGQFSCYNLQGQQFIEVTTSQIQSGVWCI